MNLPNRIVALVVSACAGACAAHPTHDRTERRVAATFRLVNATFDSVTALAIAPSGSEAFTAIELGQPLQGGLNELTFRVPAGGCRRDLRITFRGGRTTQLAPIDMCRVHAARLDPSS